MPKMSATTLKKIKFSDATSQAKEGFSAEWIEDHGHPDSHYRICLTCAQKQENLSRFTIDIARVKQSGEVLRCAAYKTSVLCDKDKAERLLIQMTNVARENRGFQSLGISLHLRERYPKWQKTKPSQDRTEHF
jgi:hypothetical protein